MAEAVDDTQAQSRALLQAIAQEGQRGRLAYEQSQAEAQAQQMSAIDSAIGRSAQINAPAALQSQLAQQAAAPTAQRMADVGAATSYYNQDIGRLATANSNYMDQVSAAVPVVQSTTDRAVAGIRAQQEEAAAQRALQREIAQMQLEGQRMDLEQKRAEQAGGGLSVSEQIALANFTQDQGMMAADADLAARQQSVLTKLRGLSSGIGDAVTYYMSQAEDAQSAIALLGADLRTTADADGVPLATAPNAYLAQFGGLDPGEVEEWLLAVENGVLPNLGAASAGKSLSRGAGIAAK